MEIEGMENFELSILNKAKLEMLWKGLQYENEIKTIDIFKNRIKN